jgi:hypothetical protein
MLFVIVGLKFEPVMVMFVPIGPEVGTNNAIVGREDEPLIVFLNTEIEPLLKFPTTTSGLPSPSISARTTLFVPDPVVKSTLEAKELVVIEPAVLVFL